MKGKYLRGHYLITQLIYLLMDFIIIRSFYIATYALCGFANFPSIGIQIGGFGAMSPERKSDFAQIALRAMIGGCWVSFTFKNLV